MITFYMYVGVFVSSSSLSYLLSYYLSGRFQSDLTSLGQIYASGEYSAITLRLLSSSQASDLKSIYFSFDLGELIKFVLEFHYGYFLICVCYLMICYLFFLSIVLFVYNIEFYKKNNKHIWEGDLWNLK